MNMPKVSFILSTRNVEKYIGSLLESIFSQEYDGEMEVLIIDSSDDRTPEIVKEFPIKYIWLEPEDYNYGKTRNEGAAITDGDFLVFLSADVEIKDKRWLSKLISHFSNPEVAGVYGRHIPREDAAPMEQFFILRTYPPQSDQVSLEGGKLKKSFVFFSNVNSAIRRSVWEQIKFPVMLKGEEEEWAKRALLAGYKILYDGDAAVYHSHKYSLKTIFQECFDTGAFMPVVYQGEGADYSMKDVFIDGLKYISGEFRFMIRNGYWHWIPYAIIYDIMKFLGVFLGSKQKYMPLWMKRALCRKKNHWDKYDGVIKEAA